MMDQEESGGAAGRRVVPTCVYMPASIPLPTPLDVRGDVAGRWKRFKVMWSNYEIASQLNTQAMGLRVATFKTCIGSDALDVLEGFTYGTGEDETDLDDSLAKMETFCVGEVNELYERYTFNRRDQAPGERFDTYLVALRKLVRTCNYGALAESLLRDRIVMGIQDQAARKRMLQDSRLTLKDAIGVCRAYESTDIKMKAMVPGPGPGPRLGAELEVSYVKQRHKTQSKEQKGCKTVNDCAYCGYSHQKQKCPAWGKTCAKCGRRNHFAGKCLAVGRQEQRKHVRNMADEELSEEAIVLNMELEKRRMEMVHQAQGKDAHSCKVNIPRKLYAVMKLGQPMRKHRFQMDCGSTVNVLSGTDYQELFDDQEMENVEVTDATLVMFNKSETKPLGRRIVTVINPRNHRTYKVDFIIVKGECVPILGARAVQYMKLMTVNLENVEHEVKSVNKSSEDELLDEFEDVFSGLGRLPGKLHLEIDKSVPPVKLPVRRIPLAIRDMVREELDRLVELGVIAPVDTPTDWISSLVVVMKSSGKVRLYLDPKPLNKALRRNHYPLPTLDDVLPNLSQSNVFSVADAKDGFWQVELDEESSYLTTFGTPFGRYRYVRMPFGISPAPEEFLRRFQQALQCETLAGVEIIADDLLVHGRGLETHDRSLRELLQRCRQQNIKLNKEKLKLHCSKVRYMGHILTAEGLGIDPAKVEAIRSMPHPTDQQALRRLLGMVNYLQRFAPRLAEVSQPLRDLLKSDCEFLWQDFHDKCLQEIKEMLTVSPVLGYFDPSMDVVVQCDASDRGLGACLTQQGRPVAYASRALTDTESNYAQIEKELLAIVYGMQKFETYVYGRHVVVQSDHKPLETILKKALLSAPRRLQRMMLQMQRFDYEVVYKKGTTMYLADTLSRAYLTGVSGQPTGQDHVMRVDRSSAERETEEINLLSWLPVSEARLMEIRAAMDSDERMSTLRATIRDGWPVSEQRCLEGVQEYSTFKEELTLQDGLILKGERLVIPVACRNTIMERLHASHAGIQSCLRRARDSVYWPGMAQDLTRYIQQCPVCNQYQTEQQKEPLFCHEVPERPWQIVSCDLFELDNKHYVVLVDHFSDYYEVDRISDLGGQGVIPKLKAHFARHGIPSELMTDNGPPFNGRAFQEFACQYDFEHVTSSPHYAQSNGKAENAVKLVKNLIRKAHAGNNDVFLALLEQRNIPTEGIGASPVQRLFGRRTRTLLPVSAHMLDPAVPTGIVQKLKDRKARQKQYYDRQARALPELRRGDTVRVSPINRSSRGWFKARVEAPTAPRSYRVRTEDGQCYRRNRRHLRLSQEPEDPVIRCDAGHATQKDISNDTNSGLQKGTSQSERELNSSGNAALTTPDARKQSRSGRVLKPKRSNDFIYQ